MALLWSGRKRSENAYAAERIHRLICQTCGFGRSERFAEPESYPLLISATPGHGLNFILNPALDILKRSIDATSIGLTE